MNTQDTRVHKQSDTRVRRSTGAQEHRDRVSRAAGGIAPVILSGGRVVGTWELEHGDVVTEFFPGEKALSRRALAAEVARVTDN